MLRDIFDWWTEQLAALLPMQLRFGAGKPANALIVEPDPAGATVMVAQRRGHSLLRLGRFATDAAGLAIAAKAASGDGRPRAILLRIDPSDVLEKHLVLPAAAERELARLLAYEMDRETPFSPEEVWWDWRIAHRDRQHGRLHVALLLAPKAPLADLIAALGRAGLEPTAIEAGPGDGEGAQRRQILLDPGAGRRFGWNGAGRPLGVACALLAVAAVALPFLLQSLALGRAESRLARLGPQADRAQQLRRQIGAASVDGEAGSREALEVLAAATDVFPDDTYLTELSLRRHRLTVSGQSADAAKLIAAMTANPTFKDPAFSAAVTRAQGAKRDTFSIAAEVRP
jgi:general secretion pathway protein L